MEPMRLARSSTVVAAALLGALGAFACGAFESDDPAPVASSADSGPRADGDSATPAGDGAASDAAPGADSTPDAAQARCPDVVGGGSFGFGATDHPAVRGAGTVEYRNEGAVTFARVAQGAGEPDRFIQQVTGLQKRLCVSARLRVNGLSDLGAKRAYFMSIDLTDGSPDRYASLFLGWASSVASLTTFTVDAGGSKTTGTATPDISGGFHDVMFDYDALANRATVSLDGVVRLTVSPHYPPTGAAAPGAVVYVGLWGDPSLPMTASVDIDELRYFAQ